MFYMIVRGLFRIIFKIIFPLELTGVDNIPANGPAIICSNHISWWDPPLMAAMNFRPSTFMAKEELFKNYISRKVIYALGGFPVKRGVPDRKAIKTALENLNQGKVLTLFPEGTRSKTGQLLNPLPGAGYIALKSKAPIIPVAIKGPYKVFRKVQVKIGPPIYADDVKIEGKGKAIEYVSRFLMQNIKDML
ncbi:lysophospholipid acyltransferase family protein [Candidatus Contubernalis alkaliaceticus]|uniref:lysophospholipid acyltransferase family protein n=1 Tax=Candidatus Contubernalis alkaliaceticus TaxID=338645 RepID=UPI001F4C1374|nr:lysophospholipid acyltransferase family protein [Candidatus Contubernalis alkalaceticus]UNC92482.1 1-acyl-sn-glycerol-3-phosphate acyltransferase [Candidatus Contubernalis alkalaceticus]